MTVRLTIGGRHHDGWTQATVRRSIETIAAGFTLALSERTPGALTPRAITPGEACTISLDGEQVISGYIDSIEVDYDMGSHGLTVQGRDRTGDLVDCSAAQREWTGEKLEIIAQAIAAPFGIAVTATEDTGEPFRKFTIERGESGFEAIDRLCRLRGLLPISDGAGGIQIGRAARTRADVQLVRGINILSARGRSDWSDRHSEYTILGQQPGSDEVYAGDLGNITRVEGVVRDDQITRHRPLVVLAEQGLSPSEAAARVKWEAAVRRGRSRQITATVQGWREGGLIGAIWSPGRLVRLRDDWMGIDEDLLIATVEQRISDGGTVSALTLMARDAFLPEPIQRQGANSAEGSGAEGSGFWHTPLDQL